MTKGVGLKGFRLCQLGAPIVTGAVARFSEGDSIAAGDRVEHNEAILLGLLTALQPLFVLRADDDSGHWRLKNDQL